MSESEKKTTPEERRRNVRLVTEVEGELEGLEGALIEVVLSANRVWLDLDRLRGKLRTALGLPKLDPPPPLIEKIAAAAAGEETK